MVWSSHIHFFLLGFYLFLLAELRCVVVKMKPQELKVGSFYFHYENLVLLLSKFDENDGYFILNFLTLADGQVIMGEFNSTRKYNLLSVF